MRLLIIFIFPCTLVFGQDTINWKTNFGMESKSLHILRILNSDLSCYHCGNTNSVISDSPQHHFAIYNNLSINSSYKKKYMFKFSVIAEERSHSGGNNTLNNIVLFPKISLIIQDTFKIGSLTVHNQSILGDLWDENFEDLTRIYNIDFQGLKTLFFIKHWGIGLYTIGDLSKNIGLGLHELHKLAFLYNGSKSNFVVGLSENSLTEFPQGNHITNKDFNITGYSHFKLKNNSQLYFSLDTRINSQNTSFAMALKYETSLFTIVARYYQKEFNKGYKNEGVVRYRRGTNYVGNQLYPLKNYYYSMNQWAFITQHQTSDLLNLEFKTNIKRKLYKSTYLEFSTDLNAIYLISDKKIKLYPLYNLGVSVVPLENTLFKLSATNKHMNLDTYYQTFYISKLPFIALGFELEF